MSDTILVTGANRGIGLEITRALLDDGHRVLAACREPNKATALAGLSTGHRLDLLTLDVGDAASVATLPRALAGLTIDALVNNAGRMRRESGVDGIDHDDWARTFAINSQAPLRVATALKPNLLAATNARVMTISSRMGSIALATTGSIAYRSSKAAVNMTMRCLANEWADAEITVCVAHPGWVRSDMGGDDADLSTRESARDLVDLLQRLQPTDSGRFLNHDGSVIPW